MGQNWLDFISTGRSLTNSLACALNIINDITITDTSDVQNVKIEVLSDAKTIRLQCNFIAGSNTRGCMVVLVGELNNITLNLTKDNEEASTMKILSPTESFKCYYSTGMVAYDIESDGAVGTLAVPGHLEKSDLEALCNG